MIRDNAVVAHGRSNTPHASAFLVRRGPRPLLFSPPGHGLFTLDDLWKLLIENIREKVSQERQEVYPLHAGTPRKLATSAL